MRGNKTADAAVSALARAPAASCRAGRQGCCPRLLDFASFGARGFIYKIAPPGESAPNVPKNRQKIKKTVNNFHFSVVK